MKIKGVKESFEIAGVSVGLGVIGGAVGSPGLQQAGQAAAGFISPVVNIGMGSTVINRVKEFKRK